ncbi:hypothetical protein BKA59DRAFT_476238 [Fusarium tricinctum]|uniref:WSC domain-containing protein n=2 Tax=Fusarium tricinctum species complex TaxID=679429 RepID=A0A8K0RXD5_9HYPO|nr:hypothetical protein BKA59DRAFT_476238 [Fusarium tricinctum]
MFIFILLSLVLLTTALPAPHFQYIGCISRQSSPTFTPASLTAPITISQCIQACSGKATLVAIGNGICFCDQGSASASFELVDEQRCSVPCVPGDGRCGGEGVLSLYQISGCKGDCTGGRNGTVPPIVPPSPCTLCGASTPVPTPATKVQSAVCPPGGCQTVVTVPTSTPVASNSTAKPCPSGGCSADGQSGSQAGSDKAPTGQGSNAAPGLASESPRLHTSGILSAIAAVIFGLALA